MIDSCSQLDNFMAQAKPPANCCATTGNVCIL